MLPAAPRSANNGGPNKRAAANRRSPRSHRDGPCPTGGRGSCAVLPPAPPGCFPAAAESGRRARYGHRGHRPGAENVRNDCRAFLKKIALRDRGAEAGMGGSSAAPRATASAQPRPAGERTGPPVRAFVGSAASRGMLNRNRSCYEQVKYLFKYFNINFEAGRIFPVIGKTWKAAP